MTLQIISRRNLIAASSMALAAVCYPATGSATPLQLGAAEQFVQINGARALSALGDPNLDHAGRSAAFSAVMRDFADLRRVSVFVLGRYASRIRNDQALLQEWNDSFSAFAMANYEARLMQFRGSALRVTGSQDRIAGQDVVVTTELRNAANPAPRIVRWRMVKPAQNWRAVDVSVVLGGNEVWLAQQQQAQFLAELDRSGGDVHALAARVRQSTAQLIATQRGT